VGVAFFDRRLAPMPAGVLFEKRLQKLQNGRKMTLAPLALGQAVRSH
jgi:hypothetical protein